MGRTRGKIRKPQKIAAEIGAEILSGHLRPKARLATETHGSDDRLVSRPAYREAIRILAAKGLIEAWPGMGTRVAAAQSWHLLDPEVLSWMFAGETKLPTLVALFELRGIIEPQIAALAAERRTARQLTDMGAALETMARVDLKSPEGQQADEDFHLKLIEACGNPFLGSMRSSVTAAIAASTAYKHRTRRSSRNCIPDHRRIFDAVAAGDAQASAHAMRELIQMALADALKTQPAA